MFSIGLSHESESDPKTPFRGPSPSPAAATLVLSNSANISAWKRLASCNNPTRASSYTTTTQRANDTFWTNVINSNVGFNDYVKARRASMFVTASGPAVFAPEGQPLEEVLVRQYPRCLNFWGFQILPMVRFIG